MPVPQPRKTETNGPKLKQSVRLGINLIDYDGLPDYLRVQVAKVGMLRVDHPHTFDKDKGDERFVELLCDTLRGALLVDLVRSELRSVNASSLRVYIKKGYGSAPWVKVPYTTVLTELDGKDEFGRDKFVLSSDVFPVEVEKEEYVPPPIKRIEFRRKM